MKRLIFAIALAVLALPYRASAQSAPQPAQFDPCAFLPKQSAAINISSATDTQLVALQANTPIYVCGYTIDQVNGTGSIGFEYGTGTNCATGKTALQGQWFASTVASGVTIINAPSNSPSGSSFVVPAGNALCVASTGTIQQSGYVSYIQVADITHAATQDPCNIYPKSVAAINFSSATTSEIVPTVAGATTYVCGINWEDAGRAVAANTTIFKQGTKVTTPCDTGAANLTGPLTGTLTAGTPTFILGTSEGSDLVLGSGNELCATTSQASTVTGYVTYVQR